MDYKQAGKIRDTGLGDLISQKLANKQSLGSSIKSSVGESLKAKATGIKEKFDPLNIAKFMTGGSSVGPSIVGKLTGRSQEDVSYFTGVKPKLDILPALEKNSTIPEITNKETIVKIINKTATKITNKVVRDSTKQVVYKSVGKTVKESVPIVVDKSSDKVVRETVPYVATNVIEQTVPFVAEYATDQATPLTVEAAVPQVIMELSGKDVAQDSKVIRQIVKEAVPQVIMELSGKSTTSTPVSKDSKGKGKDPLFSTIGSGKATPIRKNDGAADVVSKLYNLMKTSYDKKIEAAELERDFAKEKKTEDEIRHKEFIKALMGIKPKEKKKEEKKEEEESGLLSNVLKLAEEIAGLKSLKDVMTGLKGFLARKLGLSVAEVAGAEVAGAEVAGAEVAGAEVAAAAAIAPELLATGAALLFVTPFVASAYEKHKIEKNPNAPEYKDNPYAMKVRGEVKTEAEGAAKNKKKGLKQYKRQEIEDIVNSQVADRVIEEEYGKTKPELKKWLEDHPNPISIYQAPPKTVPTTLQRLGVEESTAGQGRGTAQLADYEASQTPDKAVQVAPHAGNKSPTSIPSSASPMPSSATPMPSQGSALGKEAVKATNENNEMKMQETSVVKPTIINNTSTTSGTISSKGDDVSVPINIRNDEDSFSWSILKGVRVV